MQYTCKTLIALVTLLAVFFGGYSVGNREVDALREEVLTQRGELGWLARSVGQLESEERFYTASQLREIHAKHHGTPLILTSDISGGEPRKILPLPGGADAHEIFIPLKP